MPEYVKVNQGTIDITGAVAAVPDPSLYLTNPVTYTQPTEETRALISCFDQGADVFQYFAFDATDWQARQTVALGLPDFVNMDNFSVCPIGGDFSLGILAKLNAFSHRFAVTAFRMGCALDGTYNGAIGVTNYEELEFDANNASAISDVVITGVIPSDDPYTTAIISYADDPTTYYGIAVLYGGVFTLYNSYSGEYCAPRVTLYYGADFLTVGENETGDALVSYVWNLEAFTDWKTGPYNNTPREEITFDDAAVQAAIAAGGFLVWPSQSYHGYFAVQLEIDGAPSLLVCHPDTATYSVYEFNALNGAANFVIPISGGGVGMFGNPDVYAGDFVFQGENAGSLYYGVGVANNSPVVGARYVPRYLGIRLPCFVNCIPLIDRRNTK